MDIKKTDKAICLLTLAHYLKKREAFQSFCAFLFDFHNNSAKCLQQALSHLSKNKKTSYLKFFYPLIYSMDYPTAKPSLLVPHETSVKALRVSVLLFSNKKQFINVTLGSFMHNSPKPRSLRVILLIFLLKHITSQCFSKWLVICFKK